MDFFVFFVLLSCMAADVMCAEEDCRQLEFRSQLSFSGTRLINHIIQTVKSVSKDFCGPLCFMEPNCFSFNMEVVSGSSSVINCELNNSTHNEHPDDLEEWPNYIYRGSEHACREKSCKNDGICQAGFTEKGYRCVCASGFTGQDCTDDVDECNHNAATHKCPANADCVNTHGSYNCTCKSGYTGNGLNCTDIDECAAPVDPCNAVANSACNNTNGSYTCQCKDGFVKNGPICEADVCQNYQVLSEAERKKTFVTISAQCDNTLTGWYRFEGAAGKQMAITCPLVNRCGGTFPGWLSNGHPTQAEGIVKRTVCFNKANCCSEMTTIQVKNCGSYYIYKLTGTPGCNKRYCGTD